MNGATLRQIEYFVAACETGSVSAAADHCRVTQATVSAALSELERSIAVPLLVRTPAKGVELTSAGERVLPVARRMLQDADTLAHLAWEELNEVAGPLRIACTVALSPRALPVIAHAFNERYPGVDLQLFDGLSSEVQRMLADRTVDCALLYTRQVTGSFETRPVRRVHPYAVLPADHRFAQAPQVALADLSAERLIVVQPSGSGDVIQHLLHEAGITPNVGWSFVNPETVRAMVARGLGYSVFSGKPKGTVTFDGRSVTYVPISDLVAPNEVALAYPQGHHENARLRALEQLLAEPETQRAFG